MRVLACLTMGFTFLTFFKDLLAPAIMETPTASAVASSLLLPIDENSTIASDIDKIWHEPETKEVCVQLKQDARCPHPALVGRLSGPALAILEWNERPSDQGTVLCGAYDHYWLDAGYYFVEILITHCKDFGVNALKRNGNKTAWLEANHRFTDGRS